MKKYSFKISWLDDVEEFRVEVWYGNEMIEEQQFQWHRDAFDYIAETQEMLQIAGEDWTLTY